MRICMITSSYPRNAADGAGSFVASLARSLVDLGHEVHVVAPWDDQVQPYDLGGIYVHRYRYAPNDTLHTLGHGRSLRADIRLRWVAPLLLPAFAASAIRTANRLHGQTPFDIVHGHWAVPGATIAAWLAKRWDVPLVASLHGSDVYVIEHNPLYAAAARFAFRQARQVMACSADLRNRAVSVGLSADKSQVVPYGVDSGRFCPGDGSTLRHELGIPQDALVIGAMGRLVHKKGFEYLIDAFPTIREAFPQAWCVIGGEGDLRDALATRIQAIGQANRCLMPGNIAWATAPLFYNMCDVLAVPSVIDAGGNVDGLPNVLLESLASGCAVVATRVAGIPDTIRHQENGLLVSPGDAQALADACTLLLSDAALRKRLGAAARDSMRAEHTWPAIAKRHARIYHDAVAALSNDSPEV